MELYRVLALPLSHWLLLYFPFFLCQGHSDTQSHLLLTLSHTLPLSLSFRQLLTWWLTPTSASWASQKRLHHMCVSSSVWNQVIIWFAENSPQKNYFLIPSASECAWRDSFSFFFAVQKWKPMIKGLLMHCCAELYGDFLIEMSKHLPTEFCPRLIKKPERNDIKTLKNARTSMRAIWNKKTNPR